MPFYKHVTVTQALRIDAAIVRVHQHGCGAKRGSKTRQSDAITCKIHAIVDAPGSPLRAAIAVRKSIIAWFAFEMRVDFEITDKNVWVCCGYDTDKIVDLEKNQNSICVIPSRINRTEQRDCNCNASCETENIAL